MDRFEGIPGYKVVAKLDYVKSRRMIGKLMAFTDKWYVFDEFLRCEIERSKISAISHDWCNERDEVYPRYAITFHYETTSIIKVTDFVQAASDKRGRLRFIHIESTKIYPYLSVR